MNIIFNKLKTNKLSVVMFCKTVIHLTYENDVTNV